MTAAQSWVRNQVNINILDVGLTYMYETEFVLFLVVLESSVFPMG